MNNPLKIVSLGDLHFGNPRINSKRLYEELCEFLYPELKDAHLVTVGGDIYDQLTMVGSQAHYYATKFIRNLFSMSHETGMQVRILHGTFTHDRDQLSVFKANAFAKTRFAIVNNIFVEELTDFSSGEYGCNTSLRVAYLPDNLSYKNSEDAVEHLKTVMSVAGYPTVDLLIGHGTFDHVIPADSGHKPACLYTASQFEDLVSGLIIMSHIHTASRKDNIYYCGSFERMAHGEEENKGFYAFTRDENKNNYHARFVVNKAAMPFVSIVPVGTDIPSKMDYFKKQLDALIPNHVGFVRVIDNDTTLRSALHKYVVEHFPNIVYNSKSLDKNTPATIQVEDINLDIFDDVRPDEHNLPDLVYQFLEEKQMLNDLSKEEIVCCVGQLLETTI